LPEIVTAKLARAKWRSPLRGKAGIVRSKRNYRRHSPRTRREGKRGTLEARRVEIVAKRAPRSEQGAGANRIESKRYLFIVNIINKSGWTEGGLARNTYDKLWKKRRRLGSLRRVGKALGTKIY
jgi:hypothetical protein